MGPADGAGDSRGLSSQVRPLPPPSPASEAAMSSSGTRMKTVRLTRLNPGFMRRLEEEGTRAPWSQTTCTVRSGPHHRSSSSSPCMELARVQSEMAQLRAELAAQRVMLAQERDATSKGKATVSAPSREEVRRRAFKGGRRWAAANDYAILSSVVCSWHMAAKSRREQSMLQAQLFQEEALRGMALQQQKTEMQVLELQEEERRREVLHSLRTELAEAEARYMNIMNQRAAEEEQQRVIAAASQDRTAQERSPEAVGLQWPQDLLAEMRAASQRAGTEDLLAEMRAASQRAGTEVQNEDVLQGERERVEFRLAVTEMQQEEALAAMQRRHAEAVQELQGIRASEDEVFGMLAEDPT